MRSISKAQGATSASSITHKAAFVTSANDCNIPLLGGLGIRPAFQDFFDYHIEWKDTGGRYHRGVFTVSLLVVIVRMLGLVTTVGIGQCRVSCGLLVCLCSQKRTWATATTSAG